LIGTNIGDLEPWMTKWPLFCIILPNSCTILS